jgi:hypothetical protein
MRALLEPHIEVTLRCEIIAPLGGPVVPEV